MFYGCTSLTTAPDLPATMLEDACYSGMFSGCTSLSTAPELPATTLAHYCYDSMFSGCTSLTTAPELPATILEMGCYRYMFYGCSSLTTAPELLAQSLVTWCYVSMFYNCEALNYVKCLATEHLFDQTASDWLYGVSETGTFVKSYKADSWQIGPHGIPEGWTVLNEIAGSINCTYTIGEPMTCITLSGETAYGVMNYPFTFVDGSGTEVAHLEFILAEGATDVEAGNYVSTEYAHEIGQLANGYYLDLSESGWGVFYGGSYYVDGTGEKVYIQPGVTVSVVSMGMGVFRFSSDGFDITASGPNYVPAGDEPMEGVVLKIFSGLTYTMEDQTAMNTTFDGSALSGVTLWKVSVYQGTNQVAGFDLLVNEGSDNLVGTYSAMSYPDEPGKAGIGWGFSSWGIFGGCYYKLDGSYYFIPSGETVTVSSNADGSLKFRFVGNVQNENNSVTCQGGLLLDNVVKS